MDRGFFHLPSTLLVAILIASTTSAEHYLRTSSTTNAACNFFDGRWVYDKSYPIYDTTGCPFVRREFDCQKYGRPDTLYLKYRWQPQNCNLPRFDGKEFLRRWRGKEIMFIGDSLMLNQYESFLCMLHDAVPGTRTTLAKIDILTTVRFEDYNLTVMYYLSHYLVDVVKNDNGGVLKLDSIQNGDAWLNKDILIFNTFLWWYTRGPSQIWDYVQEGEQIQKDMDRTVAFSKALATWAKWIQTKIDPGSTKVFFQGLSPSHYHGNEWGESAGKSCWGETKPLNGSQYPAGPIHQQTIVRSVVSNLSKSVSLLDVTLLSQLRKDAHTSGYNGVHFANDCTHWCIAGLPDTWNQLLYASLI